MTKRVIIGNDLEVEDFRLRDAYAPRSLASIHFLIIHHAATGLWVKPERITQYHVSTLGRPGNGYNFLVYDDTNIVYVGDIATIRAHTYGYNLDGIGICLVGNFDDDFPSSRQTTAARKLVANLQYALGWHVPIVGHQDMLMNRATHCPGLTWPEWRLELDPRARL